MIQKSFGSRAVLPGGGVHLHEGVFKVLNSPALPRLAGLALAAGVLLLASAGCGGSDTGESADAAAGAPAPPAASATPTIGGTTEEEIEITGSAQFIELRARAQVAYDCAEADPTVTELATFSGLGEAGADDGTLDIWDDGMISEVDYFMAWGGSFSGGDPEPAELGVTLFATTEDADRWAEENPPGEDTIRYGRTFISYSGLEEHGDYGDYDAEPLDTTAFTNSLHRCFDLAGGFD